MIHSRQRAEALGEVFAGDHDFSRHDAGTGPVPQAPRKQIGAVRSQSEVVPLWAGLLHSAGVEPALARTGKSSNDATADFRE
jgi:hypothetical protein